MLVYAVFSCRQLWPSSQYPRWRYLAALDVRSRAMAVRASTTAAALTSLKTRTRVHGPLAQAAGRKKIQHIKTGQEFPPARQFD